MALQFHATNWAKWVSSNVCVCVCVAVGVDVGGVACKAIKGLTADMRCVAFVWWPEEEAKGGGWVVQG